MRKHVKRHLVADLARKAEVSDRYIKNVLDDKCPTNTLKAQQIATAGQILENALETANKQIDKIFKK